MALTLASNAITFTDSTSLSSGIITAAQLSAGAVQQSFGNTSGAFSFRNKIINGNFDIWQRGTTGFVGGVFSADRWRFDYNTNDTVTFSRQTFPLGQTEVPGEPIYFIRATITAGNTGSLNDFRQRVEDVRTLAGKTVTLSYYIRGSVNATVPPGIQRLVQVFGTGGTPSTVVQTSLGAVNITTSWQKIVRTVALPSIQDKTLGTNNNHFLDVIISLPVNVTGTFDIAQVQLEEGPVATPFEQRPIGLELSLCQRYYEADGDSGENFPLGRVYNFSSASTTLIHRINYKVQKRAGANITAVIDISDGSPITLTNANSEIGFNRDTGFTITRTVPGPVGQFMDIRSYTANAEL